MWAHRRWAQRSGRREGAEVAYQYPVVLPGVAGVGVVGEDVGVTREHEDAMTYPGYTDERLPAARLHQAAGMTPYQDFQQRRGGEPDRMHLPGEGGGNYAVRGMESRGDKRRCQPQASSKR